MINTVFVFVFFCLGTMLVISNIKWVSSKTIRKTTSPPHTFML